MKIADPTIDKGDLKADNERAQREEAVSAARIFAAMRIGSGGVHSGRSPRRAVRNIKQSGGL